MANANKDLFGGLFFGKNSLTSNGCLNLAPFLNKILTASNMSIRLMKRGKKSINFLLLKDAQLDGRWAASAKLEVHRWPLHSPQPKKPLKYPPLHQLLQKLVA